VSTLRGQAVRTTASRTSRRFMPFTSAGLRGRLLEIHARARGEQIDAGFVEITQRAGGPPRCKG
jgi:hypothetical protein